MSKLSLPAGRTERQRYARRLADIKTRIQAAQARALSAVNAELIQLYWECGRLLDERQTAEGWVLPSFHNWPTTFATSCLK